MSSAEHIPHGTLWRLNRELHKHGKHACTTCLEVYDRTHVYFHWRNEATGALDSECRACASASEHDQYIRTHRQRQDRQRRKHATFADIISTGVTPERH